MILARYMYTLVTYSRDEDDMYEHMHVRMATNSYLTDPFGGYWVQSSESARVRDGGCIFQYLSRTDAIKPSLLFSNFVGSLYFRMILFPVFFFFFFSLFSFVS